MRLRGKVLGCLFALPVLLVTGSGLRADQILDYGIVAPTPGTISYAGGSAPLVGTNIQVDVVTGVGTPLNDLVTLTLTQGLLNFSTGNLSATSPNQWIFSGGGSITLTGGIGLVGIPTGTTLFSGSFLGGPGEDPTVTSVGGTFKVTIAAYLNTQNPVVAAYFGLPTNVPYLGNINLSFSASGLPPNKFTSSTVLSGDLVNSPTPEPSSLILLSVGAVGLIGYGWRRRQRLAAA